MSESIIEQVKRLAEAKAHYARTGSSVLFDDLARDKFDFPALLAHMQAQQAVVDAARELRKLGPLAGGSLRDSVASVEAAIVALDAALEKVKSNAK